MKNYHFKTYIKIISFLLIFVLFVSCNKKDGEKDTLTISYVKTPLNIPSIVERNHKIFERELAKNGIKEVKYAEILQGSLQTNALLSGDVDILNAVGATSVLITKSAGVPIKIISVYSRSPRAFRIYTTDENINNAVDLKGKTIAGSKGSNLHELLLAYLETAGLTENDVNFINMNLNEALIAGLSRKVDCVLLGGVASKKAEEGGLKLLTTGEGLMNGLIVSACTEDFYNNHSDLVKAFLDAQKTVLKYIDEHEGESFDETSVALGIPKSLVEFSYNDYDFDPNITAEDIASLQKTADFLYKAGLIEQKIEV